MATMQIREHMTCSCGSTMFPSKFDNESKKIEYQCIKCKKKEEHTFETMKCTKENPYRYGYFMLNDDGDATWKCQEHGHCDFNIEKLIEEPEMYSRFLETGCGLCKSLEETEDLIGVFLGNIDQIEELLDEAAPHIIDSLIEDFGEWVDNTTTLAEAAAFWLIEEYGVNSFDEGLELLTEKIEEYEEY